MLSHSAGCATSDSVNLGLLRAERAHLARVDDRVMIVRKL
jgi:hypothetical protein